MAQRGSVTEAATEQASHAGPPPLPVYPRIAKRAKEWLADTGLWWLCSFAFHAVLIVVVGVVGMRGAKIVREVVERAPAFEEADLGEADVPKHVERFELGEVPEDPTELNTDSLTAKPTTKISQEPEYNDDRPVFEHKGGGMASSGRDAKSGGLGGFDIRGPGAGPAVPGKGGVGGGSGEGTRPGSGGDGSGFGSRGAGSRKALLASGGGTRQSERAVAAALNWLARHQIANGAWSLTGYKNRCVDDTCSGTATSGERVAGATALGLLPFLAAGQTNESRGPYKKTIAAGVKFLVSHQRRDGCLAIGGDMYDHGLAAIALCECYGMSGAKNLKGPAQAAIDYIVSAQDPKGGGWRYDPREPGDVSVTGWQVMALKSGQMASLVVRPETLTKAGEFLDTCSSGGQDSGRYTYMPHATLAGSEDYERATTAIGLLCRQYMHVPRGNPAMKNGVAFLMQNLPGSGRRNVYYWYYGTQVMHNQPGRDWDVWNRKMRHLLIETQCKQGCATGSWDPQQPTKDIWGESAGRLMVTSLSALTLEVYYRYLPLYKLDRE